jgi:hypothetical protein
MIDEVYLDYEERLMVEFGRDPTYEEVMQYMDDLRRIDKKDERQYHLNRAFNGSKNGIN